MGQHRLYEIMLPVVDVLCVHNYAHPILTLDVNAGYNWSGDIAAHRKGENIFGTIFKPLVAGTAFGIHLGDWTQS
jgi:hypothetical protein